MVVAVENDGNKYAAFFISRKNKGSKNFFKNI
jgi:hypothetical protein